MLFSTHLPPPHLFLPTPPPSLPSPFRFPHPKPPLHIARAEPLSRPETGPVELPPSSSTLFATSNDPTPLQVSTSVLLTGAISVFLFRSLRRRARRAKESRVRSSGVKEAKDVKQEALESLKAISSGSLDVAKTPTPIQAFLGGIAAGVVAVILYKFTTTIEASLNRQAIPDNFSVRQITITVRTIVNGLCYLATFVFGINSIGLILYSGQLAVKSIMEPEVEDSTSGSKNNEMPNTTASSSTAVDNVETMKDGDNR